MQAIRHKDGWMRAAAAGCLLVLAGAVLGNGQEQGQVNRSLKILYAGHPGSDREKDFVHFLGQHFATVKTGDLSAFQEKDAEGFDVTILDYDGDGFKALRPKIAPEFSQPLVTVGVAGGLMCSQWGLKTGYM